MQAPTLPRRPSPPAPRPSSPSPRFPGLPATPPVPTRPAAREERPAPPPPLERLRGTTVRLHLINGEELVGPLVEVARYEVVVRLATGTTAIVQKGAIAWVEEARP